MPSLYIHIPFCLKKCPYCDFYSVSSGPDGIPQHAYLDALSKELEQQAVRFGLSGSTLDSVYFGGGTPSLMDPLFYEKILNLICKRFRTSQDVETTIEINPSSGSRNKLEGFRLAGINRCSIGVQSFDDRFLKTLGRLHSAKEAQETIDRAMKAGFSNVSCDIMWGLPGQTPIDLDRDLDATIRTGCRHISAYQLTPPLTEQTVKLSAVSNEDILREMWLLVHEKLVSAGFEHYEISNFASYSTSPSPDLTISRSHDLTISPSPDLTKFRSRHNMNYWRYGSWLGLGPGASSTLSPPLTEQNQTGQLAKSEIAPSGVVRLTGAADVVRYLSMDFGYDTEYVSKKDAMFEFVFLGLRLLDGIDLKDFEERFATPFNGAFPNWIEKWTGGKFARLDGTRLTLTLDGMLISNELFGDLGGNP